MVKVEEHFIVFSFCYNNVIYFLDFFNKILNIYVTYMNYKNILSRFF